MRLVSSFNDIEVKTNPASLIVGLKKVFRKIEKDGFDFKKHDPTAYVAAVAKAHKSNTETQKTASSALQEKEALRTATEGVIFQGVKDLLNGGENPENGNTPGTRETKGVVL